MPIKLEILDPVGTQLFDAITAGVRVGPRDVRMCNNGSHHYRDTKKKNSSTYTYFFYFFSNFLLLTGTRTTETCLYLKFQPHKRTLYLYSFKKKHTQTNYFIMLLTIKVHLPQFLFFLLLFTSHGH